MSESSVVEYTTEGAIAHIHINRPDVLNAFNREVYKGSDRGKGDCPENA